jgi:hypothetical protein
MAVSFRKEITPYLVLDWNNLLFQVLMNIHSKKKTFLFFRDTIIKTLF